MTTARPDTASKDRLVAQLTRLIHEENQREDLEFHALA